MALQEAKTSQQLARQREEEARSARQREAEQMTVAEVGQVGRGDVMGQWKQNAEAPCLRGVEQMTVAEVS